MKYFKYLDYIIRHKYFVMIECFKQGLYWQGIVHDASKLLPSEFFPYVNHFHGKNGKGRKTKEGRDKIGYYKPTYTGDKAFDFAWLLHQKRNKHHWQWWVLAEDNGDVKKLEMPIKYIKEMLCDWKGAARAQEVGNKKNNYLVKEWYYKNCNKMQLNPITRARIQAHLALKF